MQRSFLDNWLDEYATSEINLGESGVANGRVRDFLNSEDMMAFADLPFDYGDSRGTFELRDTIASLYPGKVQANVLVTHGVTEALLLYFLATFKAGTNIIIVTPTFHPLYDTPALVGYEIRKAPSLFSDAWALPLKAIESAIDARTAAIVVCTPCNPTGKSLSSAEWTALIRLAEEFDCDILADEQYRFLPYDSNAFAIPSGTALSERVVSLSSPGKCFGCVDLRVGWICGRQEVITRCHAVKPLTTHGTFKGSDFIANKILRGHQAFTTRHRAHILQNLASLDDLVSSHADILAFVRPDAGSMAFPRIGGRWHDAHEFARALVIQKGVMVLPGEAFDQPEHFRIRLGLSPERFQEALARIKRLIEL